MSTDNNNPTAEVPTVEAAAAATATDSGQATSTAVAPAPADPCFIPGIPTLGDVARHSRARPGS